MTAEEETRLLVAALTAQPPPAWLDREAANARLKELVGHWRGQWIIVGDWVLNVVDDGVVMRQGKVV